MTKEREPEIPRGVEEIGEDASFTRWCRGSPEKSSNVGLLTSL
jgi:hypothetical protein